MAEKETGFTTMAGPKGSDNIPEIGVGMLGYAFMGKAHTNAYKTLSYMMYPPPAIPNTGCDCRKHRRWCKRSSQALWLCQLLY